MERRYNYAGRVDRPDISQHAEAFETCTGFMRAFCVLVAALAFVRRGFRSVLVTIPGLFTARVRDHRVLMRASLRGQACFRESSRNKTAARVQHQAQGDEYGQEGAHCYNADLSLDELNAER
jgi:hypothetical protein